MTSVWVCFSSLGFPWYVKMRNTVTGSILWSWCMLILADDQMVIMQCKVSRYFLVLSNRLLNIWFLHVDSCRLWRAQSYLFSCWYAVIFKWCRLFSAQFRYKFAKSRLGDVSCSFEKFVTEALHSFSYQVCYHGIFLKWEQKIRQLLVFPTFQSLCRWFNIQW